jgi:hypothetical protein
MVFNIYIFPTEAILRMLHHIDFKSLLNIVNRLNTSTKVSEKEEEEMKKLDQELQKEEEEMSEYKKKRLLLFQRILKTQMFIMHLHNNDINFIGSNGININGIWK